MVGHCLAHPRLTLPGAAEKLPRRSVPSSHLVIDIETVLDAELPIIQTGETERLPAPTKTTAATTRLDPGAEWGQ